MLGLSIELNALLRRIKKEVSVVMKNESLEFYCSLIR